MFADGPISLYKPVQIGMGSLAPLEPRRYNSATYLLGHGASVSPPQCCQCVPAAACIECTRLGAGGSLLGQCPLRNCIVRGIRAASITELCFVEKIT